MLFEERQRFVGRGLAQALLAVLAGAVVAVWLWVRGIPGTPPVLVLLVPLLALALIVWMELTVIVRPGAVHVRMRPFPARTIAAADIVESAARTYRPIREYGGWGIRFGPAGMAYNVRGKEGVQLRLKDGRRVLIGSQRAEELARAIEEAKRTSAGF